MNAVVIIPARYKSSRFPGKPLHMIEGKSLIRRVWEKCCIAMGAANVYVATDSKKIKKHCEKQGIRVIMTGDCITGTDRVAEAYEQLDQRYDVVLNVQGDEPLINPQDIVKVAESHNYNDAIICCGYSAIENQIEFEYPWTVKVVFDIHKHLLYASRAPIPMNKDKKLWKSFDGAYKQVCIYAFSPLELKRFHRLHVKSRLEKVEDIELLRIIEVGGLIKMIELSKGSVAVDTKEDADKVAYLIRSGKNE